MARGWHMQAKGPFMRRDVAIEDIGALRQYEGIDDPQLEQEIDALHVGDCVKLTLMSRTLPLAKETVLVRITRIQDHDFRGKLASRPTCARLSAMRIGTPMVFSAGHIHSIPRKEPASGR